MRVFEQDEFHDRNLFSNTNFGAQGFVFYPDQCLEDGASCKIHINLHGCGAQGLTLVMFAGYNEYAVSNDLIMLYPQSPIRLANPWGCHDIYGDTGDDFATRTGVQPSAIMKMVDRLIEPRDPDFKYTKKNLLNRWARKDWMPYKLYQWAVYLN